MRGGRSVAIQFPHSRIAPSVPRHPVVGDRNTAPRSAGGVGNGGGQPSTAQGDVPTPPAVATAANEMGAGRSGLPARRRPSAPRAPASACVAASSAAVTRSSAAASGVAHSSGEAPAGVRGEPVARGCARRAATRWAAYKRTAPKAAPATRAAACEAVVEAVEEGAILLCGRAVARTHSRVQAATAALQPARPAFRCDVGGGPVVCPVT